jgi:diguanylate cyclase (GGDEF)-like protein
LRTPLSILLVLGILVASAAVAVVLHDGAVDRARVVERGHARQAAQELEKTLQATAFRLRGVAGLFEASQFVSDDEFRAFVRPLFGEQEALNAVIWLPRITNERRRAFERSHQRPIVEGSPETRRSAGIRSAYFPVTYLVSQVTRSALGFDAASEPSRLAAIRSATRRSQAQVTTSVSLASSGEPGVVIYQPVFAGHTVPPTAALREQNVQGVVAGSYKLDSLFASLHRSVPDGTTLQIREDGKLIRGPKHMDDAETMRVNAVGRTWTLRSSSNQGPSLAVPAAVLAAGAALALLVALMLRQSFTREGYALTMVAARMSERDEAQRELERARGTAQALAAEQTALRRVATSIAAEETSDTIRATIRSELVRLFDAEDAAVVPHQLGRTSSGTEPPWMSEDAGASIIRSEIRIGGAPRGVVALLNPAARDGRAITEQLRDFAELASVAIANGEARQELAVRASTDGLTGLLNRRTFDECLAAEVSSAVRHERSLSLAIVDIDHFKRVNDRHGHLAGDAVLASVAAQLQGIARSGDTVARIGGEEFAWIMPETPTPVAFNVADRVRAAVDASVYGDTTNLTISVGIAQLGDALTADALYIRADAALYDAKRGGRNRTVGHTLTG